MQVVPDILRWSLCRCASGFLHFEMVTCGYASGSLYFERVTVSLCKWFLTLLDGHCVTVQVVSDILRGVTVSFCKCFLTF